MEFFMNMEIAVEKIAAIFYFILALSFLVNPKFWVSYVNDWKSRKPTPNDAFLFFHLMLSLLIVVFHNTWGWNLPVVITVIGWIGLTKITLYFLFPKFFMGLVPDWKNFELLFRLDGGAGVIVMGLILHNLYF